MDYINNTRCELIEKQQQKEIVSIHTGNAHDEAEDD